MATLSVMVGVKMSDLIYFTKEYSMEKRRAEMVKSLCTKTWPFQSLLLKLSTTYPIEAHEFLCFRGNVTFR